MKMEMYFIFERRKRKIIKKSFHILPFEDFECENHRKYSFFLLFSLEKTKIYFFICLF